VVFFYKIRKEGFSMNCTESLKKQQHFNKVYKSGKSIANNLLVMYTLSDKSNKNHLGISVSKKVGNSVVRHRTTRLIRESYRINESFIKSGYTILFIARNDIINKTYKDVEGAMLNLFKKTNLIK